MALWPGQTIHDLLRKLLDYSPALRPLMFDRHMADVTGEDDTWMHLATTYRLKSGWRILLNGRDVRFHGGFAQTVSDEDTISMHPPGR